MKHTYLKSSNVFQQTFTSTNYRTIYNYPTPSFSNELVVGVISFGGGVYGNIDENGYLTNGDIEQYLTDLNLPIPTIIIHPIFDGQVDVTDQDSTIENTVDIEMISGCCPSTHLTIILYLASQNVSFHDAFNYILTTPVNNKLPSIISCSWGMPETEVTDLNETNALFNTALLNGINICTATGDNGSSDGLTGGNYCDFPSSSPNVIACGGTTLSCRNNQYDNKTKEYAWNNGGGGMSRFFQKSQYQLINYANRCTPDIAMDADPNTGVSYLINGQYMTIGGTSIVAPAFAAYLACCQLNTQSIIPYIYKYANTFHDIIQGNNGGYKATVGYDRTTGVGSLNGALLYNNIINGSIKSPNNKLNVNQNRIVEYDGPCTIVSYQLSNHNVVLIQRNGNLFTFKGVKSGTVTFTLILDNQNSISYDLTVIKPNIGKPNVKPNVKPKLHPVKHLMNQVIKHGF
jgi:kumamolisin